MYHTAEIHMCPWMELLLVDLEGASDPRIITSTGEFHLICPWSFACRSCMRRFRIPDYIHEP
jgi:hypothetical protein